MASYLLLCMSTAIVTLLIGLRITTVSATCVSPQYAEYGHRGIIECNFMAGFTGLFWYLHVKPGYQIVIRFEKQEDGSVVRSGDGYKEGKFDILSNGSLIISNISSFQNQTFKVVHVDENLRVEEFYVELLTTIFPDQKFPLISACNKTDLCIVDEIESGILTCSYSHSKPPVELAWYRLSHAGNEALHGETIITEDGDWTFSSVSKTNISNHINGPLIAFSCRASSPAINSHFLESVVIMDTTKQPWPSLQGNAKEDKYFLINSEAGVLCTDSAIPPLFVWKELKRNSSHILGFAANGMIRTVSDHITRWTISHDGSLIFSRAKFEDEGSYSCTFLDGIKYVSNLEQINVFVPPDPPTIIVKECPLYENECEIVIRDTSSPLSISCYLNGVYPNVTLNMESTLETELRIISQTTHPFGRENLYNATITKEIPAIDCSTSLILTCKISSPDNLKFIQEKFILLRTEECKKPESKVAAVVISILIITLIAGCVILVFFLHRHKSCRKKEIEDGIKENDDTDMEIQPALSVEDNSATPNAEGHNKLEGKAMESDPLIDDSEDHSRVENSKPEPEIQNEMEDLDTSPQEKEDSEEYPNSEEEHVSKVSVPEEDNLQNSDTEILAEKVDTDALSVEAEIATPNGAEHNKSEDKALESDPLIDDSEDQSRVENSKPEPVNDRRQDLQQLLEEILNSIMSYPMNYANSKQVFNQDAIKIVRDNPVDIQFKKDVGKVAKFAAGALTVAGAALALFTLGFSAVLVVAGAAVGLTGFGIGLSSEELFKDLSKWRQAKPVFVTLIELFKSMAQAIATASSAHQAVENIRNDRVIVHKDTLKDSCDKIKILINKHKDNRSFTQTDLIEKFHEVKEDTKELLNIINRSYALTSFRLDERISIAMNNPFKNLDEDALTCIDNYGSKQEANSFVNFIRLFFIGDQNGELPNPLGEDVYPRIAHENTKTTITGIAAAGIVLNAAREETDVKFLGADLEQLLGQKEEHTVALTDTANLMEKMNVVFAKMNK